jgi:hypothetical protein
MYIANTDLLSQYPLSLDVNIPSNNFYLHKKKLSRLDYGY